MLGSTDDGEGGSTVASAPLDSRRQLGAELRILRRRSRYSGLELAARLGVGQATVSRMETGQVRPSLEVIERWLNLTGADQTIRDRARKLADDAQLDVVGWRAVYRRGPARRQRQSIAYDPLATRIRWFQPFMVPGPFQPLAYARALMLGMRIDDVDVWDLELAIEVRAERKRLIFEEGTPLDVIATQTGLRALPAGLPATVLREAWSAMLDANELPNVTVRIVPDDAPMRQAIMCGWVMYDLADEAKDPQAVQVETPGALLTFTGQDVAPYETAWARMAASALNPRKSSDLLRALLREND
ncbi:helix-turn-helix transcriptional regulator [Kribbella sp. NPDC026611]|uniref:helix-turn-helix domain-containing protein n=1 Tax=Kribbella sp. NPDC026611 TaxID=3154911 RepID=UPI0033E7D8C3